MKLSKKLSKKLLYSAMAFTMLTSATVAPVAQIIRSSTVRAETLQDRTQKTIPEATEVVITKLQADDYNDDVKPNGKANENGLPINNLGELGRNVKPLSDVTFVAYKIPEGIAEEKVKELKTKQTVVDVENYLNAQNLQIEKTVLTKTDGNGQTTFTVQKSSYGKYFVVEDMTATGTPETISKAYAVPFTLELPISASDGTGYLTKVNIYPKNVTSSLPKPGKDVKELGLNHSSYNIGERFSWFLKGTVPKNMLDYEKYSFTDTLDSQLDFISVKSVKYGSQILEKNNDYTLSEPTAQNRTLKVELTEAGIKKVAGLYPDRQEVLDTEIEAIKENTDQKPFLEVEFETNINSTVILGKPVTNEVKIEFDNKPDKIAKPVTTPPSDNPEVHTGGKRFVKVAAGNDATKLGGAEFDLLTEANQPINWTAELIRANNKSEYIVGTPQEGQPVKLKSDTDGSFEIKGLAYAIDAEATGAGVKYKLKETKAPAGYVIPEAPIEFAVNQTSYNKTPTTIDVDKADAEPQKVENNKRPEIPNTGGIGTAIFVVLGIVLMVVATKGMRSHKEEN